MKYLNALLFLLVFSTGTSATPVRPDASTRSTSRDCAQSLRAQPTLKKVRQVVKDLEHTYKVRMGNHYPRILHPNGRLVLSSDFEPFECRTCRQGPPVLLPLLREKLPEIEWTLMQSLDLVDGKFRHAYIIAPDFFRKNVPLIIDYSLRQFFVSQFMPQVPKIFVGSPEELSRLLVLTGYVDATAKYLDAAKIND